jgi:hypothetical protein
MTGELSEKTYSSKLERAAALTGAGAMAAAGFALWYFNPETAGFFPVCPLYKLTGLACPGCGLTRGLHAFLHGDFLTALDYNLLLPAVVLFGGFLFITLFSIFARGRGVNFKFLTPKLIYGFFIFAIVFGVVRNLPFYPFSILFP